MCQGDYRGEVHSQEVQAFPIRLEIQADQCSPGETQWLTQNNNSQTKQLQINYNYTFIMYSVFGKKSYTKSLERFKKYSRFSSPFTFFRKYFFNIKKKMKKKKVGKLEKIFLKKSSLKKCYMLLRGK